MSMLASSTDSCETSCRILWHFVGGVLVSEKESAPTPVGPPNGQMRWPLEQTSGFGWRYFKVSVLWEMVMCIQERAPEEFTG